MNLYLFYLLYYDFILAPPNKRLALIYLANEVVQQSRAKKRDEFVKAFAQHVPDTIAFAYRQSSPEIKAKIKRVVDVWKQRNIFSEDLVNKLYDSFSETSTRKPGSGISSLNFGQGLTNQKIDLPPFLSKLSTMYNIMTSSITLSESSLKTANRDYESIVNSDTLPPPKEYAQKLAQLDPRLTTAQINLTKRITSRRDLIEQLKSLANSSEELLHEDEMALKDLETKKENVSNLREELDGMLVDLGDPKTSTSNSSPSPIAYNNQSNASHKSVSAGLGDDEISDNENINTPPAPPSSYPDDTFGGFSIVDDEDDDTSSKNYNNHANSTSRLSPNTDGFPSSKIENQSKLDDTVPEYAESTSGSEDESRNNHKQRIKRTKLDNSEKNEDTKNEIESTPQNSSGIEGLDPKIAQFLSNIAKSGSLLGSNPS